MSYLFAPNEDTLDRACKDIGVSRYRLDEDVRIVREWLSLQPHLPPISEDSLICENMLLRCKGSVEMAKKAIDYNLSMRNTFPEFFGVRDPLAEDLKHLFDIWTNAPLQHLTSEGYRVKIYRTSTQEDVTTHEMNIVVKLWIMQSDLELKEVKMVLHKFLAISAMCSRATMLQDVSLGEVFIHDMANLGIAHVVRFTPTLLQNAFEVGANGCKSRIKAVHFLNAPPIVETLLKMVKVVLPKKVAERFNVHLDLESLHKHIDRAILPKDYGGDQKPLAELSRDWQDKFGSYQDWFLQQDATCRVNESKRPLRNTVSKGELFGYEGTFKKLQVD